MVGKIKPLMLLNVVLAICLVSALLFATATYAGAPIKTVYVTHSTFEAAGKVVVEPIPGDEIIHFDTKGYKEITLKVYLEGEFGDHVYVHIDFYVQETEHISGEFFLLATSETEYRTFSVKGSSLDIRFHPFKNDDPVEVSWCLYLTT